MMINNNIQQGYKDSAVGVIPSDWEVRRLGEVCVRCDYGINAPAVDYCDELPTYLRITDIDEYGRYSNDKKASVNSTDSFNYLLNDGDIVFARTGATVGKTYLYNLKDGDLVFAGFLIRFTPNINILNPYILKSITETKYYWDWVRTISMRSGQPGINSKEYSSLFVSLPPLVEQERIAEVLGCWDLAIEKQGALVDKLTERKRALMQQLLTQKKRLPNFSEPWKTVQLGNIGATYNGLTGKNKDDFDNGNYYYIPYVNIFNNGVIDTLKFDKVRIGDDKQVAVKYGDIFFTVSSETPNEVGMSSVLLDDIENLYLNSFCFGYRLNDFSTLSPKFAAYYFRGNKFRKNISLLAQGSTRFNLSKTEVLKIKLLIPSIEEQTAIAEILTTADREIEQATKKLESLRLQKRGLMQQLLTGKKRLKI